MLFGSDLTRCMNMRKVSPSLAGASMVPLRDYETSCALTIISRPFGLTVRLYGSLDRGLRISTSGYQAHSVSGSEFYFFLGLDQNQRGKRTESILFVFATRTESETPIILAHATIDAITEALVEVYRDRIRTNSPPYTSSDALSRKFMRMRASDRRRYSGATVNAVTWP